MFWWYYEGVHSKSIKLAPAWRWIGHCKRSILSERKLQCASLRLLANFCLFDWSNHRFFIYSNTWLATTVGLETIRNRNLVNTSVERATQPVLLHICLEIWGVGCHDFGMFFGRYSKNLGRVASRQELAFSLCLEVLKALVVWDSIHEAYLM